MGDALADCPVRPRRARRPPAGHAAQVAERDCPVLHAEPTAEGLLDYAEGLFVGYRGYDAAGTEPLFEFGYGLGYTTWAYESASGKQ